MDNPIITIIITTVISAVTAGTLGIIGGRLSVKSKTQVLTEEVSNRVDKLEDAMPVLLRSNIAILVALKRGKVNGECDTALKEINKYLCERK